VRSVARERTLDLVTFAKGSTMATTGDTRTTNAPSWAAMRERLERERADVIAQLRAIPDEQPEPSATTGQGETEHVVSEVEQRVQAALDAGVAARLAELDDALQRIDDGTYGRCERCGSVIPLPRLEALPHARLCLRCQADEDAERRPRRPR
jgi:RNA polymerase-binding transcription factor DksA